jgi:2-polyprenyl-3-methyl-5-hydroxy-6-metoxy-1,4-benzoquinol methylase
VTFDYSKIPVGFYDAVARGGNPIRRAWHLQKFERVRDCLPKGEGLSVLDIGCFAGTFLSLLDERWFSRQVGVDILAEQVDYAQRTYGSAVRSFVHVQEPRALDTWTETFDVVTLIEVVEHLDAAQIAALMSTVARRLKPGGLFVLSTPNYASAWPLIELALNHFSDVSYEEQHLTKLNAFTLESRLRALAPALARCFTLELKTTTHFVTPFLAHLSLDGMMRVSRLVPHRLWRNPFGNLCIAAFRRNDSSLE